MVGVGLVWKRVWVTGVGEVWMGGWRIGGVGWGNVVTGWGGNVATGFQLIIFSENNRIQHVHVVLTGGNKDVGDW